MIRLVFILAAWISACFLSIHPIDFSDWFVYNLKFKLLIYEMYNIIVFVLSSFCRALNVRMEFDTEKEKWQF